VHLGEPFDAVGPEPAMGCGEGADYWGRRSQSIVEATVSFAVGAS